MPQVDLDREENHNRTTALISSSQIQTILETKNELSSNETPDKTRKHRYEFSEAH